MKKFLLLIFILSLPFCSGPKKDDLADVLVVNNSTQPLSPSLKLKLEEILTLEEDWIDYGSLFVANNGDIIYWSGRENSVGVFSSNGKLLHKTKFQTGQGYGDVNFVDFIDYGDKYYIYDKGTNNRLNIFNREFNIQESVEYRLSQGEGKFQARMNSLGEIHFIYENGSYTGDKIYTETGIANFGPTGKKTRVDFIKKKEILYIRDSNRGLISHFYLQPFLRYRIDGKDNVWLCDRREYKIYCYSKEGNLEKVIQKDFTKKSLEGETKAKFKEKYRIKDSTPGQRVVPIIPEYIYPIADLVVIDEQYLLVIRMDNMFDANRKGRLLADLFNMNGEFLNHCEVPEFYGCYNLSNQFKTNICYKDGHILTLESDENMDKFCIKKYRLVIEED